MNENRKIGNGKTKGVDVANDVKRRMHGVSRYDSGKI